MVLVKLTVKEGFGMETKSAAKRAGFWIQGLIGGFIGGGASAVAASVVVPALSPHGDFAMGTEAWFKMVVAMFVASGTMGAMLYLKQHPVPEIIQETRETERSVQVGNQEPVMTKTKETVVSQTLPAPAVPAKGDLVD